jgi:hypothetical protein
MHRASICVAFEADQVARMIQSQTGENRHPMVVVRRMDAAGPGENGKREAFEFGP